MRRSHPTMPDFQSRPPYLRALSSLIFFSRWLQAPLYFGLIVAQGVYVLQFFKELFHLVHGMFYPAWDPVTQTFHQISEQEIMVMVLGMIDVVMIANLLVMVIVGGYETFVSRLNLRGHPDEPEWLSHVNAGALKVKLATALIGISSIHLLRSFIELGTSEAPTGGGMTASQVVLWQVVVHVTFVLSALLLALTDRITTRSALEAKAH
jgi:uncharacterized protein (TIGR00645 family)